MEEQEVEVTEAEILQLLAHAADEPHGFEAHREPAGVHVSKISGCVELSCSIATRLPRMQARAYFWLPHGSRTASGAQRCGAAQLLCKQQCRLAAPTLSRLCRIPPYGFLSIAKDPEAVLTGANLHRALAQAGYAPY